MNLTQPIVNLCQIKWPVLEHDTSFKLRINRTAFITYCNSPNKIRTAEQRLRTQRMFTNFKKMSKIREF